LNDYLTDFGGALGKSGGGEADERLRKKRETRAAEIPVFFLCDFLTITFHPISSIGKSIYGTISANALFKG